MSVVTPLLVFAACTIVPFPTYIATWPILPFDPLLKNTKSPADKLSRVTSTPVFACTGHNLLNEYPHELYT